MDDRTIVLVLLREYKRLSSFGVRGVSRGPTTGGSGPATISRRDVRTPEIGQPPDFEA
jgi:hypothetical protein